MTESAHAVLLGGQSIGTLLQRGDVARFVFSDGYWSSPNRPVLGLWFEDNPRQSPQAALRLPSWFSNLLPEGPLREWIARDKGVNSDRELQLLLRIGRDLPGAVEVIPEVGDASHLHSLGEAALHQAGSADSRSVLKFSLAGVSLKFSLLRDGNRLTIPGRDDFGDWIVKFPSSEFPLVPQNEYGIMSLASQVGIQVPEIDLVHRDALPHLPGVVWPGDEVFAYAIRRFDRTTGGGRVHIEDFAQVRGWYANQRFDGSFETVAALAFRLRDHASLQEFIRRLTFNLLVGNGDAHLKNWSLLYRDQRVPVLSPAYDLMCTAAYFPTTEDFGLKFGKAKEFHRITRSAFARLQDKLGVSDADVLDIVDSTVDAFFGAWAEGPPPELPGFVAEFISRHAEDIRRQLGNKGS